MLYCSVFQLQRKKTFIGIFCSTLRVYYLHYWHKLFGPLWQALSKHFTCFTLLDRLVPGIVWPSSSGTLHPTVSYPYFPTNNPSHKIVFCLLSSISSRRYVSPKPKHIKPRVRKPKQNQPRVRVEIHAGPSNVKAFTAPDVWNGHSPHVPHCLLLRRDVGN